MFPWERPDEISSYEVYSAECSELTEKREMQRRFRRVARRHRRNQRPLRQRVQQWQHQRLRDGNFAGFEQRYDELVCLPALIVVATLLVGGMFIVQYVNEASYRIFMLPILIVCFCLALPVRFLVFFLVRKSVARYGHKYIQAHWLIDTSGSIEGLKMIDPNCDDE